MISICHIVDFLLARGHLHSEEQNFGTHALWIQNQSLHVNCFKIMLEKLYLVFNFIFYSITYHMVTYF